MKPGETVTIADTPRRRVARTSTAPAFMVGLTERGPVVPTPVTSMAEVARLFGARVTYGLLYDALDAFFAERGGVAYLSRVVGPSATLAVGQDLLDAYPSGTAVLHATAANPGAWGAGLTVNVLNGGAAGFTVQVLLAGVEVERIGPAATLADAIDMSNRAAYVRLTAATGTSFPATTTSARTFSGGSDDRASITDTEWAAALARFTINLGPGQVSMPGRYSTVAQTQLLTHAREMGRWALLDTDPAASKAALVTNAATLTALGLSLARAGQLLAPWGVGPGVVPNTTRQIPPSATQAGMCARNDSSGRPGRPVAGDNGTSLWLLDVAKTFTDAELSDLADAGVNVIRNFDGIIQTYDNVTLADQDVDMRWIEASVGRLVMAIKAECHAIGARHMFRELDGQGFELGNLRADLSAVLTDHWRNRELYGATARDSFVVNIDESVNTPTTLSQLRERASITIVPAPSARAVEIEIGTLLVSEAV